MRLVGVLLCIGASSAQNCLLLNPFLQSFASKGVAILSSAQKKSDSKCGDEWRLFGTCCDSESIKYYALKDSAKIDKLVKKTAEGALLAATNFLDILNFTQFLKTVELQPSAALLRMKLLNSSLETSEAFLMSIASQSSLFNVTLETCWTRMKTVRSNSLCSICSGRSKNHFIGEKALVSPEVCQAVLDDCLWSFRFLISLSAISDDFNDLLAVSSDGDNNLHKMFSSLLLVFQELNKKHISDHHQNSLTQLLNTYLIYMKTPQTPPPQQLKAELCSSLLNIHSTSYLEQSESVFCHFPYLLKTMVKFMKTTMLDSVVKPKTRLLGSTERPGHSGHRLLNTADELFSIETQSSSASMPFAGDVVMFISGESATHSLVSNFESGQVASSSKSPLNISLTAVFP